MHTHTYTHNTSMEVSALRAVNLDLIAALQHAKSDSDTLREHLAQITARLTEEQDTAHSLRAELNIKARQNRLEANKELYAERLRVVADRFKAQVAERDEKIKALNQEVGFYTCIWVCVRFCMYSRCVRPRWLRETTQPRH